MAKNNYGEAIRLLAKLPTENLIIMRDMCHEVAAQSPSIFIKVYNKVMAPIEDKVEIPNCGFIKRSDQIEIASLMKDGRKIQAIKLLRTLTNCGLEKGKEYVDTLPVAL